MTVDVGTSPKNQTFAVHDHLFTSRSKFFKAALNGKWKESKERAIALREQDPHAFELYVGWVYHRKLFSIDDSEKDLEQSRRNETIVLVNAFILADMIGDLEFADVIIDALINCEAASNSCPVWAIKPIYDQLPESSPLGRLMIDMFLFAGHEGWKSVKAAKRHEGWQYDLAIALFAARKAGTLGPFSRTPWRTKFGALQPTFEHFARRSRT